MNAQSAKGPWAQRPSRRTQSTLGFAAKNATASLSSHVEKETVLIDGLKLTIKLWIKEDRQWLRMTLEDELNMTLACCDYPILCPTLDRRYHLREATVIGMRRLVQEAFKVGLISDSPGELMIMSHSSPTVVPMPTPLEEDSVQSLTDLESL